MNEPVQVFDGDGVEPIRLSLTLDAVVVDYELVKVAADGYIVKLEDPTDESMDAIEQLDLPIRLDFLDVNGLTILADVEIINVEDGDGVRGRNLGVITEREPFVPYD
jgi:hypothetical protein